MDWDCATGLLGDRSASDVRGELEVEIERKEPSTSELRVKAGLGGRVSIGWDMNGLGPSFAPVVFERVWERR